MLYEEVVYWFVGRKLRTPNDTAPPPPAPTPTLPPPQVYSKQVNYWLLASNAQNNPPFYFHERSQICTYETVC